MIFKKCLECYELLKIIPTCHVINHLPYVLICRFRPDTQPKRSCVSEVSNVDPTQFPIMINDFPKVTTSQCLC